MTDTLVERLLSIQRSRDYFDDNDLYKEEYESICKKLDEQEEKAKKYDFLIDKNYVTGLESQLQKYKLMIKNTKIEIKKLKHFSTFNKKELIRKIDAIILNMEE